MNTAQDLYQERLNRIKTAVALGKPDRVPFMHSGTAFYGYLAGVKISEVCVNPLLAHQVMLRGMLSFGDLDGTQRSTVFPLALSMGQLCKVKLPGKDLPDNDVWQVHEQELMLKADYDDIIKRGFTPWHQDYCRDRLDNVIDKMKPFFDVLPLADKNMLEAGLPVLAARTVTTPYEIFSSARSMTPFVTDLYKIPDKVHAAAEVVMEEMLEELRTFMRRTKPIGILIGLGRSSRTFVSQKMQERFVYPYIMKFVDTILEEGAIPFLHCDGNWNKDFDFVRQLPKGKCVFQLDGATDIFKAKAVVGDRVCIYGDVPPGMLTVGTADDVYHYCQKLIGEIGPAGFILGQGCDTPANAKPENVKAMFSAIADQ
ncbi:hypothetical protein SPSIL_051710 [Sporomusa silvacetica DSM 10669]|uniref:Uroporphyrinogen decarboxylase (URO-D) domain-containing protein n=1 Tax=Sporomusa silvacetica DSM 10669 TaxID=1123289 RepID=A0ABZ3IU46_9FIRM|nr:uroporphyrinogen decarboxylase family protein [Sporomusa silvacetica]OZC23416.1 methylcobalamin:coenzyme M methyltransferase [Sporomusa silvacetica DSM 10669]